MPFQVYVGNYPNEYSRNEVAALFKDFEGVKLIKWFRKELKSYCFLSCNDIEQVVAVVQKMNNAMVSGRKLIVRASDDKLHKYVEFILQENESETGTSEGKVSHDVKKNIKGKKSPSSYISPPLGPKKVLRNKIGQKVDQNDCSNTRETNSSHSKSPSSHSDLSERSNKPYHQKFSNDSCSTQEDDDDLSECVWLSVTNFPFNTPIRCIYELFDDYYPLKVIPLCNYPSQRKTLTEAHVCFLNREIANDVIMNFDNTMFNGRILLVNDVEDLSVMKELVNVVH